MPKQPRNAPRRPYKAPRVAEQLPLGELPRQAKRHVRCPCCGLQADTERFATAPYPLEARMQYYGGRTKGGRGRIIWTGPEAVTEVERVLVASALRAAIVAYG